MLKTALFLLAFSSFAFAQSSPGNYSYLAPQGSNYSVEEFSHRDATAFAIVSEGVVHAILLPFPFFGTPAPSTSRDEIASALESFYLSKGYSPNATSQLASIHAGIRSISEIHRQGEFKCRQLTGTETVHCDSFESCRTACLGTPFCPNFAQGGKPGEFIYELLAFENNSKLLESAYDAEQEAYAAFASNQGEAGAKAYMASIEGINRAATRAAQSPLYDGYSYCFSPDYSLAILTNLQLFAQKYYQNASKFYSLDSQAEIIATLTAQSIAARGTPNEPTEQVEVNGSAANTEANGSNATAGQPQSPNQPQAQQGPGLEGIAIAGGVLVLILAAGAATYFLALRGKNPGKGDGGKKPGPESRAQKAGEDAQKPGHPDAGKKPKASP